MQKNTKKNICNNNMNNFTSIKDYKLINHACNKETNLLFDVDDIKEDSIDNTENVYQLQSNKDEKIGYFMLVGRANNKPGVLIKEFKYDENHTCKVLSIIYLDSDIDEINKSNEISLLKYIIYKNEQVVGVLRIDFFTYDVKKDKKSIRDYISVKSKLKPLYGYFKYVYFYDDGTTMKKLLLKTLKIYPGNQTLVDIGMNILYDIEIAISIKK